MPLLLKSTNDCINLRKWMNLSKGFEIWHDFGTFCSAQPHTHRSLVVVVWILDENVLCCMSLYFPLFHSSGFVCYLRALGLYFGPEAGRRSCFTGTVWCKVLLRHNESSLPSWHAPILPCVQISSFNLVFFLHFYVRLFHLLIFSFICLFHLSILFWPCLFSFSSGVLLFVCSFVCLVFPLFVCSFTCASFHLSFFLNWSDLSLSVLSFACWFVCCVTCGLFVYSFLFCLFSL